MLLWRLRGLGGPRDWPLLAAAGGSAVLLAYAGHVAYNPRERDEPEFIIWTVGFWLAGLGAAAVLIWLGVSERRNWWTNVALLYLGLWVITRYFDTFGDYTQTGLVFVGAGLLLLAVAFLLERSRRYLTELSERAS